MARLNSALYGMVQLTKLWFNMLYIVLQSCGMAPHDYYLCVFMGEHVICMIYSNF